MSLRDQLQELANPAPLVQIADEDDVNIETAAQVVDFDENDDQPSSNFGFSSLRTKNLALLSEDDGRYFGKKISRKQVKEAQGLISQSDDSELSEEVSSDGGSSEGEGDEDYDSQNDVEEEDVEENDISGDENEESGPSETRAEHAPSIKTFSKYSFDEDREKGDHIKAQLNLYQMLMECRIKLQKAISLSNQLPQHETRPIFNTKGGNLFAEVSGKCIKSSERLLTKLYDIQTDLLAQHLETNYVVKSDLEETNDDTSYNEEKETDEEFNVGQAEKETEGRNVGIKRKRDIDEYPEMLKLRHQNLTKFRMTTINKWYQKVSIASKNNAFKGFETPALKQIEQILNDRNKLIKRTQLKRIPLEIMGKLEIVHEVDPVNDISEIRDLHLEDYDVEIFEDSDFYHRNLREIIEMKTSSTSDPSTSGKQFLEIQKLRSKLKRKVNTGASKGRKIRYDVIPKLVNFMAPYNDSPMTDESKNDLFNSLFGKIPIRANTVEM